MKCQVAVPAKTTKALYWAGLSLCRVLRKRELQSTDRLTQEKYHATLTTFCTGGKSPLFFLLRRSGNEWLVKREGDLANLKASVGDDQLIPPTTGWKFRNMDTKSYEEDQHLRCSITPASSSCSVRVSLKALANEFQGECEGEYKDTGLKSAGRKVLIQFSI